MKGHSCQRITPTFLFGESDRKDIKPEGKCKTRNREKAIITGKIKEDTKICGLKR